MMPWVWHRVLSRALGSPSCGAINRLTDFETVEVEEACESFTKFFLSNSGADF